ncbi:hypothetical protein KQH29_00855 [bacterium]|nr:hypothetical protein [bacterium]
MKTNKNTRILKALGWDGPEAYDRVKDLISYNEWQDYCEAVFSMNLMEHVSSWWEKKFHMPEGQPKLLQELEATVHMYFMKENLNDLLFCLVLTAKDPEDSVFAKEKLSYKKYLPVIDKALAALDKVTKVDPTPRDGALMYVEISKAKYYLIRKRDIVKKRLSIFREHSKNHRKRSKVATSRSMLVIKQVASLMSTLDPYQTKIPGPKRLAVIQHSTEDLFRALSIDVPKNSVRGLIERNSDALWPPPRSS